MTETMQTWGPAWLVLCAWTFGYGVGRVHGAVRRARAWRTATHPHRSRSAL